MKNKALMIFLMGVIPAFQAQEVIEKEIRGIVYADSASVEGIHVMNLVTEKTAVTDARGLFTLSAKEDDLLVFSAIHLDYARKSINKKEYDTGVILLKMTAKVIQLDEVVLTEYPKINAKDLGIINYTPKMYTPAERRLKTATALNPTANAGTMMGGSLSIDPLLNWISGRTTLLKKELEVEKKELLMKKLELWNEDSHYTETLKIPEEYVAGFKFFSVHDEELAVFLQSNNKQNGNFIISKLATDFLSYLKEDE